MLTVLTAPSIHPEVEAIDRDPGIITLLSALFRSGFNGLDRALAHYETYSRLSFPTDTGLYRR